MAEYIITNENGETRNVVVTPTTTTEEEREALLDEMNKYLDEMDKYWEEHPQERDEINKMLQDKHRW